MEAVQPKLKPASLWPYFTLVALIHAAAVATRYDVLAAKLPAGAPLAIMIAQFPLLMLSGYFEGRCDHGEKTGPAWMAIESKPVKAAFTFGFMYLVVVAAQTWDLHIGPVDPTPPTTFPPAQRAMWFAMFTAGFSFIFYMAAAGVLIPILRVVTAPLRPLPTAAGAVLALIVGGGIGLFILSAVQSTKVGAFIKYIQATLSSSPAVVIGVTLASTVIPLVVGLVKGDKADKE